MSTTYNGLAFATPLLARWAAFFDLAGWRWSTGVAAVGDWQPDFRVTFPCSHSECDGSHTLLVSVLPITDLSGVQGHPALDHRFGITGAGTAYLGDAGAVFGSHPGCSQWEMTHGSGGGREEVANWTDAADRFWEEAGANTRATEESAN